MRRLVQASIAAVLAAACSASTPARADDKAACLDAAAKGQALRDAHQLVEARGALRVCAQKACPAVVQADCAAWLDEVEKSLPTVVLTAKDGAGRDLVEVRVLADARPLVVTLDGKALPMDPGPHVFRFEGADGSSAEQRVVVKEGEHDRSISLVLGAPGAPATHPPSGGSPSGLRVAGWVVAALGVAGLGVGAVGGGLAIADKDGAACSAAGVCAPGPLASARTAARIADYGLVAGGVLLAGGVTLLIVGRSGERAAAIGAAPFVGATGAGLSLRGSF